LVTIRMTRKWIGIVAAVGIGCIAVGIGYGDLLAAAFVSNPITHSPESVAKGRVLFNRHCVACHGSGGKGDGMAVSSLPSRPDDLSTLPGPPIFPDGIIAYRIANGAEGMPAWKDVLAEAEIWNLLNFIRSLKASAPAK
jgi:mono/diheme cytochrome c family protein